MVQGENGLTLKDAVYLALKREGISLFARPNVLRGYLLDTMDPDSLELRVLDYHCDESLLFPYAKCESGGVEGLRRAADGARAILVSECMVDPSIAANVANGIAAGVAVWRGIAWDKDACEIDVASRHCPRCGARANDEANFCWICGERIAGSRTKDFMLPEDELSRRLNGLRDNGGGKKPDETRPPAACCYAPTPVYQNNEPSDWGQL